MRAYLRFPFPCTILYKRTNKHEVIINGKRSKMTKQFSGKEELYTNVTELTFYVEIYGARAAEKFLE